MKNGIIDLKKIEGSNANPKVIEVYRLLKRYKEHDKRKEWEDKIYKRGWEVAFGENDAIWEADERDQMTKKNQIPVAINDLAKGIQGASAVATANKPGINVHPLGLSDLYVAEILKRAFDYVWGQNDGGMVLYDIVKESKTGSLGVFDVRFDDSKGKFGKIVLESDNPLDYYWDYKSRRADKSDSHLIKAHLISRAYAKDNYDVTDDDLDFMPIDKDEDVGTSSAGKPGEDEYARMGEKGAKKDSRVEAAKVDEEDAENDVYEIEAWLIKKEKEYILAVVMEEGDVEQVKCESKQDAEAKKELAAREDVISEIIVKTREVREQRVIVGKKLIASKINPYGLDSDGDPVVPKVLLGHDRSYHGYFTSPTYRGIEISKSRNKRRSQAIYVVSKNIDAPLMRPEGTKWVKDDVHGDELIVPKDAPFAPARLLPGTASGEIMAMEQRDTQALDEEFDMHDVMKGKSPPGVDSGRMVLALQEQAGMMSTPYISAVESAVKKVAKVIYSLMLQYWPRKMWERLIDEIEKTTWQPAAEVEYDQTTGEKKKPEPTEIEMKWMAALERISPLDPNNKPQIDMEELDIKIVAGSTMPTNRMAKRMDAVEMAKAGIYDAEAVLNYVDDPHKDEIVARKKQQEQKAMQMGAMKGAK
jgi:hypothetical protein